MGVFDGSWMNGDGSVLRLKSHGSFMFGSYQSEVNVNGRFHVCGYGDAGNITTEKGLGLALSVLWRPFEGKNAIPSWHWVSAFAGQALLREDGTPQLWLNHDLVVTIEQAQQIECGSYLDKLVYEPADLGGATSASIGNFRVSDQADAINGVWYCVTPELNLTLEMQLKDGISGWLDGYVRIDDVKFVLQGFTDNALNPEQAGLPRQGLSVCASLNDGRFMALSGYFDREQDRLVLLQQISRGTHPSLVYVQTSVCTCIFQRLQREE